MKTKPGTIIPLGTKWRGPDEEGEFTRWIVPYAAQAAQAVADPDACCGAEDRDYNGGCRNCGDPCL